MTIERAIQLAFDGIISIFAVVGMLGTGLALPLLLADSQPVHPSNATPRFHVIEVEMARN